MIRGSGTYASYRGRTWSVSGRIDLPEITLYDDSGATALTETARADEVGRIEKVGTSASWRGGRVTVADVVTPALVSFYTDDQTLAEREGLRGDRQSGWRGTAATSELEDTSEHVVVLREAGSRA